MSKEEILAADNATLNILTANKLGLDYFQDGEMRIIRQLENGGATFWNPAEVIKDAFEVLDSFKRYEHIGNESGHVIMVRSNEQTHYHKDKSFCKTVCVAALLAVMS